jgi:hypothetical protein
VTASGARKGAGGVAVRAWQWVTPEEQVSLRALALGLPFREATIRNCEEHVSLRALALGLHIREVLTSDYQEHVQLRALALGLDNMEV